ncbi:MAG: hypothetical protein PVJ33_15600 [Lysobacterales bacterium]|jgi:hypothetical protein
MRFEFIITRAATICAITCFMTLAASTAYSEPNGPEAHCQAIDMLDRVAKLSEQGRPFLDRSHFDTSALLDSLDWDSKNIVNFVRKSIAFEQYEGALRGPRGTLLSRAGNALDQSILLAKLLRDAGYEARIARAHLPKPLAQALLQQLKAPRPDFAAPGDVNELTKTLVAMAEGEADEAIVRKNLTTQADPRASGHHAEVVKTTQMLSKALTDAGIWPISPENASDLAEEASDYFWVQFQDQAADGWQDLHPAFGGKPPERMPQAQSFLADSVPEELQHRFRLQLFIERLVNGKLELSPITNPYERPVANLLDVPLTISNLPESLELQMALQGRKDEAVRTAGYFMPMFNGAVAPEGRFFDLRGTVIDPMAASSPGAGVFAQIGKAFGNATAGLGGSKPVLTAQWLELTLIAPGGGETVFRRAIFDRLGPAMRASGAFPPDLEEVDPVAARPLLKRHTIMVTAAQTPEGLRLDRVFDQNIRAQPVYHNLLEYLSKESTGDSNTPLPAKVDDAPNYWLGHLSMLSSLDQADRLSTEHRIYRSNPSIIIHSQGPDAGGGASEMIDIVTNPRRAVRIDGPAVRLDPQAAMMAGVWDTALEGALLRAGETRLNTAAVFEAARLAGTPVTVIPPGQPVGSVDAGADVKAAVAQDLSNGFAVVIPEALPDPEHSGWWRVNPVTGEAVGQISGGHGADLVEWLTVARPGLELLSTYGFLALGLSQCMQAAHNCSEASRENGMCQWSAMCCMVTNTGFYLMGLGLAGIISIGFDVVTFHVSICNP